MVKTKYIYFITFLVIILIVIKNWTFLENKYNYLIYKENCIISYKPLNSKNKTEALTFCECKIKYLQNRNIEIFVSKLKTEEKFSNEVTKINSLCTKQLIK